MRAEFEIIQADEGSSFRLLHQKVSVGAFRWSYHYHPEYEIVVVFQGSGRRHVGNHLSYYTDGDLVLIGSNVPHAGFGYGTMDLHEEVVIQFKENFLGDNFWECQEMAAIKQLFERSKQGIAFHGETRTILNERFRKLLTLPHFERLIELLNILQYLANATEYTLLNPVDIRYNFSLKDQERLSKIYKFVEENFTQEIDIQLVADLANLTVPAFCNYFKKNVNQTFTEFVNEYRVNQACKMLLRGEEISDVCFHCGFNNVSYFGRVFRELKGKSPSQFRRIFAETNTNLSPT